jgi:hypothetical protein
MRYIYKNPNIKRPDVSLVLLDWSCRESFHIFDYLKTQTAARPRYEIILIEYYDTVAPELKAKLDDSLKKDKYPALDKWIVMDMPRDVYYHKHLMYNIGIALSAGDIVMIGDSDAIVSPHFIRTIIKSFRENPNLVLHMDQFRNVLRKFHPFNYPKIREILSDGCINNVNGQTKGVLDTKDPLHSRNYGACMCAKRDDMIAIGGADEHIDLLGFICGPYDLTFRLVNMGREELWHPEEFTYHVWHPGQAGAGNHMGPHDGKHVSTRSLEAVSSKRVLSCCENSVIKRLRKGERLSEREIMDTIVDPACLEEWRSSKFEGKVEHRDETAPFLVEPSFYGVNILIYGDGYFGVPQGSGDFSLKKSDIYFRGSSLAEVRSAVLKALANVYGAENFEPAVCAKMPMVNKTPHILKIFPPILVKSVKAHNIVRLFATYFCVPLDMPVNWEDNLDGIPRLLKAATLEEAEALVGGASS